MMKVSSIAGRSKSKTAPKIEPPKRVGHSAEMQMIRLFQRKQINEKELKAGLGYINDFIIAGMAGYYAHVHYHMAGVNVDSKINANDNYSPSEFQLAARYRLDKSEKRLGQLAASCFYHVLGLGMTMRDFAHKISSTGHQGKIRILSPHQAMGVFLGGLSVLAE